MAYEMTQEQLRKFMEDAEMVRKKQPCPVRPEGCGGTGQGRCRFMVPAPYVPQADSRIQVVGNPGPPKVEIHWVCQFDLIREEIDQMHYILSSLLEAMAIPVPGPAVPR